MALLIKTNGEIVEVEPKNGTDFKEPELHKFVNGYYEIVGFGTPYYLCVNDNGKYECEPNMTATVKARMMGLIYNDVIYGDALFCDSSQIL